MTKLNKKLPAEKIIKLLDLKELSIEGGLFRSTYSSAEENESSSAQVKLQMAKIDGILITVFDNNVGTTDFDDKSTPCIVIEDKKYLLAKYKSQLSSTDYLNSTVGLNMYHSRTLGTGVCKYAEKFFEIPAEEYIKVVRRIRFDA